jgi:subtilisin-like proprotein convertase family protein
MPDFAGRFGCFAIPLLAAVQIVVPKRWPGLFGILFALITSATRGDTLNFSNTNYIAINDSDNPPTIATPYPSPITVSGLTGEVITHVTVTLNGFTHSFPSDVNIILVGPLGQTALLMSNVGGQDADSVTDLTITLDDQADAPLPILDPLFSGTFQPTASATPLPFDFPPPAPAGNSNAPPMLSVFNGTDPDGIWKLFVVDDVAGDDGYISNGWSLSISAGIPLALTNSNDNVVLSWPVVTGHTFTVQFSPSLTNATWTNLSIIPAQVAGRYIVTNAKPGGIGIFRLLVQ